MSLPKQVGIPIVISVCDPSPPDLARTGAVVRETLRVLHRERYAAVYTYGDPGALLAGPACDVCVTETDLGTMDGFALIDEVRRHSPGAAAIIVTADANNESALKAWEHRVSGYLIKPLEHEDDLKQLRALLELCISRSLLNLSGNQMTFEPHGAHFMRHMPHEP